MFGVIHFQISAIKQFHHRYSNLCMTDVCATAGEIPAYLFLILASIHRFIQGVGEERAIEKSFHMDGNWTLQSSCGHAVPIRCCKAQ